MKRDLDDAGAGAGADALAVERGRRERAERALEQSEARLRRLFDTNVVAMMQWDLERSVVVDANAEFLRLTGYDRDDVQQGRLNLADMKPDQGLPVSAGDLQAVHAQGSAPPYEKQYLRKDGSPMSVLIAGTRFDDTPSQGMTFLIDVSEVKRAEAALRRSEHLLQRITAVIPNVVYVMRLHDQSIVWVNPQVATVMGYPAEDVVALGPAFLSQVMHPEDLLRMPAHFAQLAAAHEGELVEIEYRLRQPDGGWRWFQGHKAPFTRDAEGRVSEIIGTAVDITGRRQEQERMRTSEMRYRRLFEASHDGVLLVDPQTRQIVDANPFMTRLLGYPSLQLIGKELFEIGLFKDEAASQEMFRQLRAQNRIRYENLPLQSQAGRLQEVEVVANLYAEDGREIIQFNIRDITERKQSEAMLQQLADALADADRRKDEFLATLAHELRSPLATLKNAVELMKRGHGDAALMERVRPMMERQTDQMLRLTEDLLDISRITHDKLELRQVPVELGMAMRHAAETAAPACESAGIQLRLMLLSEPAFVLADPARLAQTIGNLLSNACKFTRRGGAIELRAERDGARLLIRVKDNGIGIAPSMLDRVFELFTQARESGDEPAQGLGIGLSLVQRLVHMHGGSVTAHSEGLGLGSEFIVRLPAWTESRQGAQP